MYKSICLGIFLTIMSVAFGQSSTEIPNERAIQLNKCVQFINESIKGVGFYYEDYIAFNLRLRAWQELPPATRETEDLSFDYKNHLNISSSFETPPSVLYREVKTNWKAIPKRYKFTLDKELNELFAITKEIDAISKKLASHIASGAYKTPEGNKVTNQLLGRASLMYFDFSSTKERFYARMRGAYFYQYIPPENDDALLIDNQLQQVLELSRMALITLRMENVTQVKTYVKPLEELLEELKTHQSKYLDKLNRPPRVKKELEGDYQAILTQGKTVLHALKNYLNGRPIPKELRRHGRSFYYYNNAVYDAYAGQDALVESYNRFCKNLSDEKTIFLEATKEPNWFKAVTKDIEAEEVQKLLPALNMSALEEGQTITIDKFYFDIDSFSIDKSNYELLDELVAFMKENPYLTIEVQGHTNGRCEEAYCNELSANRAKSVSNYLIQNEIPAARITSRGYGKSKPIASNKTKAGRAKNQRVEIKIISIE